MTHKLNLRFGRKSPSFSQVCWEHKYYLHNFHVLFYNDLKFQGEFVEVEKTQSFFFPNRFPFSCVSAKEVQKPTDARKLEGGVSQPSSTNVLKLCCVLQLNFTLNMKATNAKLKEMREYGKQKLPFAYELH